MNDVDILETDPSDFDESDELSEMKESGQIYYFHYHPRFVSSPGIVGELQDDY